MPFISERERERVVGYPKVNGPLGPRPGNIFPFDSSMKPTVYPSKIHPSFQNSFILHQMPL